MMSVPGTDDDKLQLINCVSCHTLERVVKSSHDADEFVQVIARMNGYAQVSQPIKPQRRVDLSRAANPERFRKVAEYLATINLSSGMKHEFELKTLPRVKGRGTNVIITEYDLPRPTIEPHDVIVVNGEAWYSNFGEQFLGKLDPKTGKHTEYAMPELRKGFPTGNLDLGIDRDGHLLLGMMYQGGVARFDPKTEKFQIWQLPPERLKDDSQLNMVTNQAHVDGKLWVNDAGPSTLLRLDLATGKFEEFDPFSILPGGRQGYSIYDVRADSQNNVYVTDFQKNYVVKVDAKTGKFTAYQTGTPLSRNRRGRIDDQDRFWFAEYRGNKIAMLDTKEERHPGMAAADQVHAALRRDLGQERPIVDRRHDQRPRDPARSQEQRGGRISAAARHQHAAHVRGQFDHAADVLGRQQPRRLDRAGRTAGLI